MIKDEDLSDLIEALRGCALHYRWRGTSSPRDLEDAFELHEHFDASLLEPLNEFLGADFALDYTAWQHLLAAQDIWAQRDDVVGPGRSLRTALSWRNEHLAREACRVALEALLPERFPTREAVGESRERYRAMFAATVVLRAACSRRFPILALPDDLFRGHREWRTRDDAIRAYVQQVDDMQDLADRFGLSSPARLDDGLYQFTRCVTDGCALGTDCAGLKFLEDRGSQGLCTLSRLQVLRSVNDSLGRRIVGRGARIDVLRLMEGLMPSLHAIREALRTLTELDEPCAVPEGRLERLPAADCIALAKLWEQRRRDEDEPLFPTQQEQLQLLDERLRQRPVRFAQALSDMLEDRLLAVARQIAEEQRDAERSAEAEKLAHRGELHDPVSGTVATASGSLHKTGRRSTTRTRALSQDQIANALADTRAHVRRVAARAPYSSLIKALTTGK